MEGRTITPRCWTACLLIPVLLAIISPFTLQELLSRDCYESILFWLTIMLELSLLNPLPSEPFD